MFQKDTHITSKMRNDITAHANEVHFVKEITKKEKLEIERKKSIFFFVFLRLFCFKVLCTELILNVSKHEMHSLVWRHTSSTGNLMLLSFQRVHFHPGSTHSEKIKSCSARQRQVHRLQTQKWRQDAERKACVVLTHLC